MSDFEDKIETLSELIKVPYHTPTVLYNGTKWCVDEYSFTTATDGSLEPIEVDLIRYSDYNRKETVEFDKMEIIYDE